MLTNKKKRVVVVGGGTGTYTLLRGLKAYVDHIDITAIVTMADSGGSTGRLRDEFGQLPVGDVRMALAALSADAGPHTELLRELFLYRFDKGEGLSGHNFGNLFLTALTELVGDATSAIQTASTLLRIKGTVLPVTTNNVHLVALYDDGVRVTGEHAIDDPSPERNRRRIAEVSVTPEAVILPEAARALMEADVIVLGPGDLYTSIIANLVVDGFKETLMSSSAQLLYVCNLMSRLGQTQGMNAAAYIDEITRYAGRAPDGVVINTAPYPEELLARYQAEGTHPVEYDGVTLRPHTILTGDIISTDVVTMVSGDVLKRSYIRHDGEKLAARIMSQLHT